MMRKPVSIVLISIMLTAVSTAMPPQSGESLEEVLDAHCAAREDLVSLRASFTQTKVFTLFGEEEKSAGEFAFLRPGMIRWQFTIPDSTVTVIKDDIAWTVLPHIRQVHKSCLGGSSTDRVMSIIGFGSCGEGLTEDFEISFNGEEGGLIILDMVPLSEEVSPYFSAIEMGLDRGDYLPRRIVFNEHSGDLLVFEFSNVAPGSAVDAGEFDISVPDGFEIVEY
jgi:outer membrane lipoprotein-sorting protein